jgi:transglutaminase-like putative cysteine protease
MRLAISHLVTCRFSQAATGTTQTLRMEPRAHAGQYVERWRIDVSADCLMKPVVDPYGNLTCTFALGGPLDTVTFEATGDVVTEDTVGIVRGVKERLPRELYRRDTLLTLPDPAIRDLAASIAASTPLDRLHALMHHLADTLAPKPAAETGPAPLGVLGLDCRPAATVLADGTADDVDAAHLFVATARAMDLPARFVCGYVLAAPPDAASPDAAPDTARPPAGVAAWAEAWCAGIGWIGFDVARRLCPTDTHVRLSAGPDLRDAQPLRIAVHGADLVEVGAAVSVAERPAW